MKASDLLIKCLENEGVEYIFGLPGEETLDLMESLRTSTIRFILTRHEQAAAFMADAYGRLTGKAGVCIATLGPGATNLLTGVADAFLDKSPLVAITGQADLKRIHKESHQYIDIVESFKTVTKWNGRIESPEIIPEMVRKAFKVAETEKPGSVHLELPENVAAMEVDEMYATMIAPIRPRRSSPDRQSLRKAAELIEQARFPVILAGHGVVRKSAGARLQKFAELFCIPVVTTFMGKGGITAESECCIGTLGLSNDRQITAVFSKADLVIAAGYDLVEYSPANWNPQLDKKIIHIDFTTSEVDHHYVPEVEIISDIRETLELLEGILSTNKKNECVIALRRDFTEGFEREGTVDTWPPRPPRIIYGIRQVLGASDIVISDVGMCKLWAAKFYPVYRNNTFVLSNGFASMGFSLPSAIAAKLIYPERNVVALSGDGGFMMNLQDLETACRLKLNIVVVIFDDGGYDLIKWKAEKKFGTAYGVDFSNPDFVKLAESFGAIGVRLKSSEEFEGLLRHALTETVPVVIDIPIDYSNNEIIFNRL
ncbi:MAG TPA: acetolactate synthase large subunit [Thermodesulfovibrionales bacterium]|nr:acetolactate synthase large subunit [Thermodesulfovibrionales bacterium]